MATGSSLGTRLYRGELNFEFVGNAKRWYLLSGAIVLICLASMGVRGFNFGIEFEGGNSFQFVGTEAQIEPVTEAVEGLDVEVVTLQLVGQDSLIMRTPALDNDQAGEVVQAISDTTGIAAADVSQSAVSARWGGDITSKAVQALIVFLIAVVIFIAIRFQPKMAFAAVLALLYDLVTTAGLYSLVGFEVTPSTVIGLLTILGFSLYDTVVVFDKVDENTRGILGGSRTTYSGAANLAVNQTLMRSINTSVIALLPVAGLLFVGAGLLGAGTLKDLALVLFVGLATGAYSSIFLATPLLCSMKEREPAYVALAKRVEARKSSGRDDVAVVGAARTPSARDRNRPAPGAKGRPAARAGKAQPAKAPAAKAPAAKAPAAKAQPTKAQPAKAQPAKAQAGKTQPAKTQPAKTEPGRASLTKTDTAAPIESPTEPPAKAVPAAAVPAPTPTGRRTARPSATVRPAEPEVLEDAESAPEDDVAPTPTADADAAPAAGATGGPTRPRRTAGPGARRPAGKRRR